MSASFGVVFIQFLLTVVIAAILYAHGEYAADWARRFGVRLAGASGEAAVRLSATGYSRVALGVVVTALVQALLGGLGLLIAGVPFAAILTAVMFHALGGADRRGSGADCGGGVALLE